MNSFTKKTPLIAASLLAAASLFGQDNARSTKNGKPTFDQGYELGCMQMMSGYNAPARIDVRCAWDFFADASFTYWQPIQDNMELGMVNNTTVGTDLLNTNVVNLDFSYKPGFKVGVGMNFDIDSWDSRVDYTWFRGSHSTSTTVSSPFTLLPMWIHPNAVTFTSGSEKWRLNMDILDWDLGRSYYVGRNLTFRTALGARAAWIRQRLTANYAGGNGEFANSAVTQKSHSWAVGPRADLQTNWLIGEGFRFYGNGGMDVLFTQYTKLSFKEDRTTTAGVTVNNITARQKDVNALRPHLDLELGLGWGTYFDNNNWHVDLAAGYGFQVFFNQNMFRHFEDSTGTATSSLPRGDLYVHGLTLTARFDF